jgi:hypothetical protein
MIADVVAWLIAGGPLMLPLLAASLALYALLAWHAIDPREVGRVMVISALITAVPLIGLAGTVHGIMRVLAGGGDPHSAGAGIGEALIATQFGLSIAIPAMVALWLVGRRAAECGR